MAIAACSSQNNDAPASKSTTDPVGGSSGSGGSGALAGTGGGSAGSASPAGGRAGAGAGGSSAGAGGVAGLMTMQSCDQPAPVSELISDFSSNYTGELPSWFFGDPADGGAFNGGGYVYPAAPSAMALSADLSQGNLHVSGTVSAASGFGLWFASCSDASAFKGISFKIGGNVGDTKQLRFSIQTNEDQAIDPTNKKGACPYTTGTINYTPDCVAPSTQIQIADVPALVEVPFDRLSGGNPHAGVSSKQLLGIQFAFADPTLPYDVDLRLDDVRFYGGPDSTGAAGASNP